MISKAAKHPAAVGTSFSFTLNEAASVTLTVHQSAHGRKTAGRCVAQTKKNRKSPVCARVLTKGRLPVPAGHTGTNHLSFQGRFSAAGTLKPGRYTVSAVATNTTGQHSHASTLAFTVVR